MSDSFGMCPDWLNVSHPLYVRHFTNNNLIVPFLFTSHFRVWNAELCMFGILSHLLFSLKIQGNFIFMSSFGFVIFPSFHKTNDYVPFDHKMKRDWH